MKRLFLLVAACLTLAGCSGDAVVKQRVGNDILCINGHLYYGQIARYDLFYTPLFDARTNVPTLISCPDVEDGALLVKGD